MSDVGTEVAVIGMAGRFPGAGTVEEFWANLCDGVESISVLTDQVDPDRPDFTPAYGVLSGADEFDAEFFGYSPNEATLIDPQQRIFLECAYTALERAGHGGAEDRAGVGIYAGCGTTMYADALRAKLAELPFVDEWRIRVATAPDFLSTRAAYKLGLGGPAVTVQTACSTSLVAVHLAVQALLAGECDIALAGGVAAHTPTPRVRYTEGGIVSPDGHCRAFDAAAQGTVGGNAVALVVLRPLEDALADGDHVHAVIRGSAVNNDGTDKIGFTAPSVSGQAEVVRTAQRVAGIDPADVGYIEAHGTATRLGDPIEVTALTQAFGPGARTGRCRIGSVKTNIGHTDAAAGVTGLIKTVLAVEHGLVPPSLHFERSNPEIDFAGSPFTVNDRLWEWPGPRLAGVSALGVGGTNAHVVVAQPPARDAAKSGRPSQLVVLSAKTERAADAMAGRLAARLRAESPPELADVAWTLQVGREEHPHRRFLVGADVAEVAEALTGRPAGGVAATRPPEPVFMFPGQGGQHVHMAGELYRHLPVFRRHLDECADLAAPLLGLDLREVLFPGGDESRAAARLATIGVGQPAVFAVEYALSRLLTDWGVRPAAVVGHSLGAYAAACVAGVLSLPDAVRLVVTRGRLLQSLPSGGMAAVRLPEAELRPRLPAGLDIGAVNGPRQCTVTGPAARVAEFAARLAADEIDTRVLHIATAGHSPLVEPIQEEFRDHLAGVELRAPELPVLSDTTGEWATPEALTSPEYWVAHLRQPVRFGTALGTLLDADGYALVETGPGRTLVTLARQHPAAGDTLVAVQTLPHPDERTPDLAVALTAAGRLWAAGVALDWARLHDGERRERAVLPGYPFERRRYHVAPDLTQAPGSDGAGGPAPRTAGTAVPRNGGTASPGRDGDEQSPVLVAVLDAFTQALGVPEPSPQESFFDLGGDSLIAAKIAAWGREMFAVPLSPVDVLRGATAAALARVIEERTTADVG